MMDKTSKNISVMSDNAILSQIGAFVRHHRLDQNLSQQALADKAGINRTTLGDLELGRKSQLLTLLSVLRMLNQLQLFETMEVRQKISPIKLAEFEMKERKRAWTKAKKTGKKESDW